jgi:ABC-type Fe3+ transport system permease subunit
MNITIYEMILMITNFDSYALIAAGLFVIGLFLVIVYEKSSSKAKQRAREQQTGTSSNVE